MEAVEAELDKEAWVSEEELDWRVNKRLGREDISWVNIATALSEVSGKREGSVFDSDQARQGAL